ncbi:AMP-binding protein [Rhodococcus sp. NPDC059968]|uniref:AMP-binding protein n=1 Tax=Rhodococcus sp. NPDC059968 TaxID=3347017 RepID=UPI00367243AF
MFPVCLRAGGVASRADSQRSPHIRFEGVKTITLNIDLASLLEARAQEIPNKLFLSFPRAGIQLTYREFDILCNRTANGFRTIGVGSGDFVAQMVHDSQHFLTISYAIKKLGAVEVPIGTDFRGDALRHILNLSKASVLAVSPELLPALAEVANDLPHLRSIVVTDGEVGIARDVLGAMPIETLDNLMSGSPEAPDRRVRDTDLQAIGFTSGTTGPPKACMLSHRYAVRAAESMVAPCRLTSDDRVFTMWPLHHVAAAYYDVLSMMLVGGSVVSVPSFEAAHFWDEVRASGATWFEGMGSLLVTLHDMPASDMDRDHSVRFVWGAQFHFDVEEFENRFGWQVLRGGGYSSTDGGSVALPVLGDRLPEACAGTPFDTHEVRIFDDHDNELPVGEEGEIVLRPREADVMFKGYLGMPEATLAAQRNLWFHTGDVGHVDSDGRLYYSGRKSDRIKRFGASISTHAIVEILDGHPSIAACAVVPSRTDTQDDDVHAYVELRPGHENLEVHTLTEYSITTMPRYMVPSRIFIVESLPRTPTGKVAIKELVDRYGIE